MAIKVVQGLIGPTTSNVDPRPVQPVAAAASQRSYTQQAATSPAAQMVTHSASSVEAAVSKIRAQSASRKRQPIRSLEEALGLVEQVALSLMSEEEGASHAHADLTPEGTRSYLT